MDWRNHIVSDPEVLMGKPAIKGTRLSIEFLVKLMAGGWSEAELLENYPRLRKEHLQAIFQYVSEELQESLYLPFPQKVSG